MLLTFQFIKLLNFQFINAHKSWPFIKIVLLQFTKKVYKILHRVDPEPVFPGIASRSSFSRGSHLDPVYSRGRIRIGFFKCRIRIRPKIVWIRNTENSFMQCGTITDFRFRYKICIRTSAESMLAQRRFAPIPIIFAKVHCPFILNLILSV
jgi:hypothetical protein